MAPVGKEGIREGKSGFALVLGAAPNRNLGLSFVSQSDFQLPEFWSMQPGRTTSYEAHQNSRIMIK
jgi:hypothetical protein